jgi:6-phosphogluconolactonase (cycloisomerase 2 family)
LKIKYGNLQMRLNIAGLMRSALSLAALPLLAACPSTTSYTIGGTVNGLTTGSGPLSTTYLVLQDNGGDNLTITQNGAFTFPTALTSNATTSATYNVTVSTQPSNQICSVTNGSGTATGNVTSVVVSCSSGSTSAYVVNASRDTVSQYPIGGNGVLPTTATSSVATGTTPYAIAVVSSGAYAGQFAYVANNVSNNVSQYTISSGVFTQNINGATVTAGSNSNPSSITVDPFGSYVYVANFSSGTVTPYTINSNGTLTAGTPVSTGTNPNSIAVDPSGTHAYVANYGSSNVSEYTISSGVLTAIIGSKTIPAGTNPASVTVDPTGIYVYVANYGSSTVSEYSIGAGGALTGIGSIAAGTNPISVTVSGSYVYVVNHNYNTNNADGSVSEYSIGANGVNGVLTGIGTVGTGVEPSSITVDPTGSYAYVANQGDGTVSQYTISSGVLTANATAATVTVGGQPVAVITAP